MQNTYTTDCTVSKSMALLDIIANIGEPVKFNSILEQSPFPKPSTYRLLQTLVHQGVLTFDEENKKYFLGNRLLYWANTAWQSGSLTTIARPHIELLSKEINATVHLAQLDNGQVLYLDKINTNLPRPIFADVGKVGPAYCTGIGKAMLAHLNSADKKLCINKQNFFSYTQYTIKNAEELLTELSNIRQQGVAFDKEEHEEGIVCVAVPIIMENGDVIGGLSVTGSTSITTLKKLGEYKDILQKTAQDIAEDAKIWALPKMRG